MAKISEIKKAQLLEDAVLKNDCETVQQMFEEYESFEFTARALGLACRYASSDMVKLLIKKGARYA